MWVYHSVGTTLTGFFWRHVDWSRSITPDECERKLVQGFSNADSRTNKKSKVNFEKMDLADEDCESSGCGPGSGRFYAWTLPNTYWRHMYLHAIGTSNYYYNIHSATCKIYYNKSGFQWVSKLESGSASSRSFSRGIVSSFSSFWLPNIPLPPAPLGGFVLISSVT